MDAEAKWYVLHTYAGYETIAQENLKLVFEKNGMTERLIEITVPMEDVIEEKKGKRKIVQRKKFPCYIYIKMFYDNDSMWHMITNTRGVTAFCGPLGRPTPLTDEEVKKMRLEKVVLDTDYKVGEQVKVMEGPLEGFVGIIENYNPETGKCKVVVSMFGRDTRADFDISQIERML